MTFKKFISEASSGKAETIKSFLLSNCNLVESEIEIHDDLTVTIHGDLIAERQNFTRFPCSFRAIEGSISFSHCQIKTLIGMPKTIPGDMLLYNTKLVNLEYGPEEIGGELALTANHQLVSLKGAPQVVTKLKIADSEKLLSLVGGPREIKGICKIDNCGGLTSIEGIAESIGGNLHLTNCRELESLKGIHKSLKHCAGKINVSGTRFKSHIMGLFFVKGIKGFEFNFGTGKASAAFEIIFKAMKDGKDQLECQDLLIDANLESFAGL